MKLFFQFLILSFKIFYLLTKITQLIVKRIRVSEALFDNLKLLFPLYIICEESDKLQAIVFLKLVKFQLIIFTEVLKLFNKELPFFLMLDLLLFQCNIQHIYLRFQVSGNIFWLLHFYKARINKLIISQLVITEANIV